MVIFRYVLFIVKNIRFHVSLDKTLLRSIYQFNLFGEQNSNKLPVHVGIM